VAIETACSISQKKEETMRLSPIAPREMRAFAAFAVLFTAGFLTNPGAAKADMVLTQAATNQGFGLSTFSTGFASSGSVGPLGIAVTSAGVLVSDYPDGNVRLFSDTDNQTVAGALKTTSYGGFAAAHAMTVAGGTLYMNSQSAGNLLQLNADGTLNQTIVGGFSTAQGIVANPVNGHIFVSSAGGVFEVDPIAKTKTLFSSNTSLDGLTISADGTILYGASFGGHLLGFNTTSKLPTFDSGSIPGGPDGTVIGLGPLAGNIFVNTNSGNFVEINLTTLAQTLLGTGGSRGDFVSVDTNNGTLLLTQTDRVLRLTPPSGGFQPPSSPEPSSLALVGIGLASLIAYRVRAGFRKKPQASAGQQTG
jgi:PEP-CTERM motif